MQFVFIGKWLDCIILVGLNKDSAIMLNSYCFGGGVKIIKNSAGGDVL